MDIKELINLLKTSNLKLVSRETGIPNDRMYKWKQGKGNPKKEDFDTLVAYFKNGSTSDIPRTIITNDHKDELIRSLKATIVSKDEIIDLLKERIEEMKERLMIYETKPKTGTN